MAWYVILLIVSSGLILVTSVIALIFGDMDMDFHPDIDSGFLLGDVISFKGLIHFCSTGLVSSIAPVTEIMKNIPGILNRLIIKDTTETNTTKKGVNG